MTYTPADLETMARTVWGEARGEPFEGKVAVAWVIRNRAERGGWWGSTIGEVCRKPNQFSCWLESDPNRAKLEAVTASNDALRDCLTAVGGVLSGLLPDPTGSADSYHTIQILPSWALNRTPTVTIANHVFYKLEK